MSELLPEDFSGWIDWSKGDLLDACYDLSIGGTGLDSQPFATHQFEDSNVEQNSKTSCVFGTFSNSQTQAENLNNHDDVLRTNLETVSSFAVLGADVQLPRETWVHPMTRPVSPCQDCRLRFPDGDPVGDLSKEYHAKQFNHGAYSCKVTGCNRTFVIRAERNAHERITHVSGHGRVLMSTPNDCITCEKTFYSKADLLRHSKETQDQPYGCECGALFSRLDVLNRHLESFSTEDPKHPCKYCKLHRGPNGFRRMDHLMQHIRNYHHLDIEDDTALTESRLKYVFPICSYPSCPQYRDEAFKQLPHKAQAENKPFSSQSAYTKHMREEHNKCSFPCDISGCSRIGRRGYFREKDLLNHRRKAHPAAPEYAVAKRELRIRCTEPDCGDFLDPSSMRWHISIHEYERLKELHGLGPSESTQGIGEPKF